MDELTFTTLIRDTQVLQLPREFVRWDWNLIYSLLQVSRHLIAVYTEHVTIIHSSIHIYIPYH